MIKQITKIAFAFVVALTAGTISFAQQSYSFTTGQVTNITQTSATIYGSSAGSVNETWVEINTGSGNIQRLGRVTGTGNVSGTATGLRCNTTYTYQAAGMVTGGMTNGSPRTFTTSACEQVVQTPRVINFSASPSYFSNGGGTTNLTWSSENTTSCSISGIGSVNISGSQSRYVGATQSFTLNCTGTNGGSDSRTVTVQVENQVVNNFRIDSFTASPSYLNAPGNTTLSWNTTGASSCSISNVGTVNVDGSRSVYAASTQSFTLNCTGTNGGSDSRTVTVTVQNNNVCTFNCNVNTDLNFTNFIANPTSVNAGGYSTLTWNSEADYCTATGDWSGTKSASGSVQVGPIYGTKTYSLVCYKNGQSQSKTVNVYAGQETENNSAITSIPTRVTNTSVQLNGIALVSSGRFTDGWFEWGTTSGLGNITTIRQIGNNATNNYAEVLAALIPNRTYFYRAVIRNSNGTFRGDIVRFQTSATQIIITPTPIIRPTTPVAPVIPTVQTYGRPAFMEVLVVNLPTDVSRGTTQEFQVTYRSLTALTLVNAAIKVVLPEEFEYVSASRGVYSAENRTLTLNLGDVRPQDSGSINVRVNVSPVAQVGKTLVTTGYGNYTVPANGTFLAYQDEVVAYALSTVREGNFLPQTGSVAAGFFSGDLGIAFGWLLLLLILLAIIYMLRKLYVSFNETQKA